MEQSSQPRQPVTGVVSTVTYGASSHQTAAMVTSGAPAVMGAMSSSSQTATTFTASPANLSSQHQLAYQQVHQYHRQQQQQQQQQQQLQAFWANQLVDIEQTTDFKNHSLPLAPIKKIMKADEDVRMISSEAPVIFAKACELFILELTLRSWIHTEENKRRTLQKNDIAAAITRTDIFDFLVDIVPRDELKEDGLGILRATLLAVGATADSVPYYYIPAPNLMAAPGMIMGKPIDQTTAAMHASQQSHPMAYLWPQTQQSQQQQSQQSQQQQDT